VLTFFLVEEHLAPSFPSLLALFRISLLAREIREFSLEPRKRPVGSLFPFYYLAFPQPMNVLLSRDGAGQNDAGGDDDDCEWRKVSRDWPQSLPFFIGEFVAYFSRVEGKPVPFLALRHENKLARLSHAQILSCQRILLLIPFPGEFLASPTPTHVEERRFLTRKYLKRPFLIHRIHLSSENAQIEADVERVFARYFLV